MMRRTLAIGFLLATVSLDATGQEVRQEAKTITFPTFTAEQNFNRASLLAMAQEVGGFAFAKARGTSAEEYGRAGAVMFGSGWGQPNSGSAVRYARAIQNNLRANAGGSVDVMSVSDTLVTMRATRVWRSYFGPSQSVYGVTVADYETIFGTFQEVIGRQLGLRYSQRVDGDYLVMTISGRGTNAVIDFPRGTWVVTLGATDVANPQFAASWEFTYDPPGKFTVSKDGVVSVQGEYDLQFDEIVFRNDSGTGACGTPGRFRWTVGATGRLSFARLADECQARVSVLTAKPLTRKP